MNFLGPDTKADCAKFFRIRVGAVGLVLAEFFPRQLISIFGAANESSYYTDFASRPSGSCMRKKQNG